MTETIRMTAANGQGALMKKYEELVFPYLDGIDPQLGAQFAKDFKYKDGDILMCTYPKVGTHWMGNMISKLKTFDTRNDRDTILEFGPPEVLEGQEDPRIIPTHLKPSRLYLEHIENKGKVMLMLRNPKDVAVSDYYHIKNAVLFQNQQTWDEYFQSFITGEIHMGSYFTYLKEWDRVLNEVSSGTSKLQVEVFYYEDMMLKPKENLDRLNKYLGFERDEEYLDRILNETTLQALRDQYGSHKLTNPFSADDKGNSIIFRKGHVGDWKTHLTVAQSETIDKVLQESLLHGIIKFKYEL